MVQGTFWIFKKDLPHLEEKSFEIANFLERFGKISSFLLSKSP
jgi:hypothetical protein